MSDPGGIYKAMCDAMADITSIAKDRTNVQQNFKFRGIDDVYNELHTILAKHRIFTLPEVLEDRTEERQTKSGGNLIYRVLKIKHHFCHEDGSSVSSTVIGEGMDSGDKASNKAMAIGHKYSLFQAFLIPTEEEKDPDAQTHEVKSKPKESEKKPEPSDATKLPEALDDLRRDMSIMLLKMCGTEKAAQDKLQELTTWVDKEGKTVPGTRDPFNLKKEKNIQITHGKVKKLYNAWIEATIVREEGDADNEPA
jgi:hypothetical protein